MVAVPALGITRASSRAVVLPAPFGPRKPVPRPGSMSDDRSQPISCAPGRVVGVRLRAVGGARCSTGRSRGAAGDVLGLVAGVQLVDRGRAGGDGAAHGVAHRQVGELRLAVLVHVARARDLVGHRRAGHDRHAATADRGHRPLVRAGDRADCRTCAARGRDRRAPGARRWAWVSPARRERPRSGLVVPPGWCRSAAVPAVGIEQPERRSWRGRSLPGAPQVRGGRGPGPARCRCATRAAASWHRRTAGPAGGRAAPGRRDAWSRGWAAPRRGCG